MWDGDSTTKGDIWDGDSTTLPPSRGVCTLYRGTMGGFGSKEEEGSDKIRENKTVVLD